VVAPNLGYLINSGVYLLTAYSLPMRKIGENGIFLPRDWQIKTFNCKIE
jgi:hypothetical protein